MLSIKKIKNQSFDNDLVQVKNSTQTNSIQPYTYKPNLPMYKFNLLPFFLLPLILQAQTFLSLHVEDLVFDEEKELPDRFETDRKYSRELRRSVTINQPYIQTSDAEKSFLRIETKGSDQRILSTSTLRICLLNPKPMVNGSLFIKDEKDGFNEYLFSFNSKQIKKLSDDRKGEIPYLKNKVIYYTNLQKLEVPGTAWFRHQASQASTRLKELEPDLEKKHDHTDSRTFQFNRPTRKVGLEKTIDLFSGGRAISENLQLDRELRLSADEQNRTVPISSIKGITIEVRPWKELIGDAQPKLDPLARVLPTDQHALFFTSFQAMLEVMDEAKTQGTPLLRLSEGRAESAQSREKYCNQLCLPDTQLSRILGPKLINSVAMTGSDPFIRTGTSLTVLFEAKKTEALVAALTMRRLESSQKNKDAKMVKGTIAGVQYNGLVAPGDMIKSYTATVSKNVVIVTNSLTQLKRIILVSKGKKTSLSSLEEYHFFRKRYLRSPTQTEHVFALISDATIRRWCGPEWRIGASRRTRAASSLAELQARHESGSSLNVKEFPELGKVLLINGRVHSQRYGNLAFLRSVEELGIKKITPEEKRAYLFFRDRYQSHWSKYFDPIAARLSIQDGKISGDLSIMPLIGGSDYRRMINTVGQKKLNKLSGDPHPEALVHWVTALDMDSPNLKQASNFAAIMAPSIGAGAFSWIDESYSIYLDRAPFLNELFKEFTTGGEDQAEDFIEKNWGRIPLALNVEVNNPFKLTAFLAGFRAWLEQTAPGMTVWSNHSHKKQGYVKIAPGINLQDDLEKDGNAPIALYYVPSSKLLTVSLSEDIIKRTIDRALLRRAVDPTLPTATWSGKSSAFFVKNPLIDLADGLMQVESLKHFQEKSWNNLHALNEWRGQLGQKDALAYHLQVWQTELQCSGGGKYVWNENHQTYESTAFGHPGSPHMPKKGVALLSSFESINFGITFENDGLRAQGSVQAKIDNSSTSNE
jgi:hypothetical protein